MCAELWIELGGVVVIALYTITTTAIMVGVLKALKGIKNELQNIQK